MSRNLNQLTLCQQAERSLQKKYREDIWGPFITGVKQYQLLTPGDRVCVCVSGGKDSMLLAKLMQLLQRNSDFPFALRFLAMDPGYAPENRKKLEDNAALLEIPLEVFSTDIFQVAEQTSKNPCYLCARMRRGYLYKNAGALGCNKIALGHHFSDVVETTLLGMLYGAQIQAMPPKLHSRNYPGMELIRPMYCVREKAIVAWARYNRLSFLQCACRFTEKALGENRETQSKRREVKKLLETLRRTNPDVEQRIFRSIHNVQLDTLLGYRKDGVEHSFLEDYPRRAGGESSVT